MSVNCPVCGERMQLLKSVGDELFQFVCTAETPSHYRTLRHPQIADAKAEVAAKAEAVGPVFRATWNRNKDTSEVRCSNCNEMIGVARTLEGYKQLINGNPYCKKCGKRVRSEDVPFIQADEIPRNISILEYNKHWSRKYRDAVQFVTLLEATLKSVGETANVTEIVQELRNIGWPKVTPTLLAALEMYNDILKSKCVGTTIKQQVAYRQVTPCEKCGNCLLITDDGAVCSRRGIVPLNGFCEAGYPKGADNAE